MNSAISQTQRTGEPVRKRILVAHNVPRHDVGGMARMMESMHAELEAYGWQTEYFTADDVANVGSLRLRRQGFPWHVRQHVRRAFLSGRPYDIVNVHEPVGAAVICARARLGHPVIVAMSHGVEQRYWEMRLSKSVGMSSPSVKERITVPLVRLWQAKLTLRRSDHILCLNEEDRFYLASRFHVSLSRITRVFPGAGPDFAAAAPRRIYRRHLTRIIFFGTWLERKGVRQVAAAFSELARKYSEMELAVLGAGTPEERVRADFPASLHSRIKVLPPLSHAECARVLLDNDIFLLPSLFEGTPLALIEAMCTGIPAIATSTAGMKDVVKDGVNGVLIVPGDASQIVRAVDKLSADAELRERLGRQAAQDAASRYTWRALGALVNDVYSNLVAP